MSSFSALLLLALAAFARALPATAPKYIFYVIVDDLGWGNVGFHRNDSLGEVRTPTLDALVADGIELGRHYVYMQCTPSRSSFLTGRLPIHVQTTLANPESHNAGIPFNMTSIAAKLKSGGYATHVVGKWDGEWGSAARQKGALIRFIAHWRAAISSQLGVCTRPRTRQSARRAAESTDAANTNLTLPPGAHRSPLAPPQLGWLHRDTPPRGGASTRRSSILSTKTTTLHKN